MMPVQNNLRDELDGGSYAGATAIERIKQGKSKHFNTYKCDRFEKCRGKCGVYNPVIE